MDSAFIHWKEKFELYEANLLRILPVKLHWLVACLTAHFQWGAFQEILYNFVRAERILRYAVWDRVRSKNEYDVIENEDLK